MSDPFLPEVKLSRGTLATNPSSSEGTLPLTFTLGDTMTGPGRCHASCDPFPLLLRLGSGGTTGPVPEKRCFLTALLVGDVATPGAVHDATGPLLDDDDGRVPPGLC